MLDRGIAMGRAIAAPVRAKSLRRNYCLAVLALTMQTGSALAEGAVAMGMPGNDPNNGVRTWIATNEKTAGDASDKALKGCRDSKNPKVVDACKLIETFHDECFALAVNGGASDPVTAVGWAFAPESKSAISRSITQCELMRKGKGPECRLDTTSSNKPWVFCDGTAK